MSLAAARFLTRKRGEIDKSHGYADLSIGYLFLSENKWTLWQVRNRLREFLIASSQQVAQKRG